MVRPWSTFGTVMDLAKTAKICDRTKTAQKLVDVPAKVVFRDIGPIIQSN